MKFRKLLVLSSAVACALSLGSCDKKNEEAANQDAGKKTVQVGIGYTASYAVSWGSGQATVNAAFVAFEGDKVVDARIDAVQVKLNAGTEKDVISLKSEISETGYVASKLELGSNYGMKASSTIGYEVDAQIEAYADWTIGKTVSEITSGLKDRKAEGGEYEGAVYTSDDALWAKCSISVNDYAAAIKSAYDNRTGVNYSVKNAKAGIALNGNISKANYKGGYDQVSVDINGALVEDGKVVAAAIDAITFSFKTEESGYVEDKSTKYYNQTTGASISKKNLGNAYAMAEKNGGQAGCTKEWFEQAKEIEAAVVGKTAAEIKALESFGAATITVTSYQKGLARAAEYAVKEHVGPQA